MGRATAVLIAAASGRALAASARRGGYAPLVADFFGDQDTAAAAEAHVRLDHGLACGMSSGVVIAALESLAAPREPVGIVCGTRIRRSAGPARRHRAALDALLATHPPWWRVPRTRSPLRSSARTAASRIPIRPSSRLRDPANWLAKRQGGAGGRHIRNAADDDGAEADLLLPAPRRGRSRLRPVPRRRPARHGPRLQHAMAGADAKPAVPVWRRGAARRGRTSSRRRDRRSRGAAHPTMPLRGLNSADFLVRGRDFGLLEINPRPGATLDIFEPDDESLFAHAHRGLPRGAAGDARRAASKRGPRPSSMPAAISRRFLRSTGPTGPPTGPSPAPSVDEGDPLCTVIAGAATATAARQRSQRNVARRFSPARAGG